MSKSPRLSHLTLIALLSLAALGACRPHRAAKVPIGMRLAAAAEQQPTTLVWVGRGKAERLEGGVWRRIPEFDYEFSVEQRRFGDHWESVKTMRRRHPAYDGSAGPRVQTSLFRLELAPNATGIDFRVESTLGKGAGRTDAALRHAELELDADVSMFAPFDRYRITQEYLYEEGRLVELVELRDGATPWVRNHEEAVLYAAPASSAASAVAPPGGGS